MIWQIAAGAVLMLLLSAVVISWPRRQSAVNNQTPAQLFEERLQLLALAREAGELAEQDFETAATELKSQFLEQQQLSPRYHQQKHKLGWHLGLVFSVATIVTVTYFLNGHYRELSDWQLAQAQLSEYGERALLGQGEPLSDHELRLFALALRTKLAKEGDDSMAWMLLGRIWMSQGLMQDAVDAFERALPMAPNRAALLLSYSQALIVIGGDEELAKAGRAVARLLLAEPDNLDALALMALIAFEKGDQAEAVSAWQLLGERLPANDSRQQVVQQRLQELGVASIEPAALQRRIVVQLTVDPQLQQRYPDASLFVFARSATGPGLPLAVQRMALPAGELELELNESMAMQPGWSLREAEQVQVVARMSLAGTVERGPEDIEVVSELLTLTDALSPLQLQLHLTTVQE